MDLTYTFSDKLKKTCFVLMGIGILALIYGLVSGAEHQRIWANLLLNSFFFMAIALGATFFLALQYATEAAYAVTAKRVIEAITTYLPIGLACMLIIFASGALHLNHLYEWMDPKVVEEDKIIAGKTGYLNIPFFFARALAYVLIWLYFQRLFRKKSLEADLMGDPDFKIHFGNMKNGAIFLVLFGVTSSTSAWDWLMSIDVHWFSTMFGWYVFSGMWVSAMIVIILLTLHLKKKGHLQNVNENHLHDLGKWMFAISFLWTYLFFCQFMLIWYSNIPEEVTYFQHRWNHYMPLFWFTFFVNFTFPMLFLMARDSKRNYGFLKVIAIIIFIGHWLDVYMIVMPGTVGHEWHLLSPLEIGMGLGFLGLFMYVVLTSLTKAPLMVKNHPYLEESIHLNN
jgi:hypothetical protein